MEIFNDIEEHIVAPCMTWPKLENWKALLTGLAYKLHRKTQTYMWKHMNNHEIFIKKLKPIPNEVIMVTKNIFRLLILLEQAIPPGTWGAEQNCIQPKGPNLKTMVQLRNP